MFLLAIYNCKKGNMTINTLGIRAWRNGSQIVPWATPKFPKQVVSTSLIGFTFLSFHLFKQISH